MTLVTVLPSTIPGTIQNSAAMLFNSLPQDIKNCIELKVFDSKCRNHFMTLATSSSQSYLYILHILYVSCQYYFHTRVSILSINFTSSTIYNFIYTTHSLCTLFIYYLCNYTYFCTLFYPYVYFNIILFYYSKLVQKSHHVEY